MALPRLAVAETQMVYCEIRYSESIETLTKLGTMASFNGCKPFLHPRRVTRLRVDHNIKAKTETLYWKEPDRLEWISDSEGARVRHKGVERSFRRKL